jgi:D-proline reductase (dithiol) PrdB
MPVDSFKYLPRLIAAVYKMSDRQPDYPIPWTPLGRPISECKFGLVTSAGLYHRGRDDPFDLQREIEEPTWGDPTFRLIPTNLGQEQLGASHLHIETSDVLEDINILLPLDRFKELSEEGTIGGLARPAFSFMGYQGFPPDTTAWEKTYGPEVARTFKAEAVDCVLLTPA